jgi:hypothetical protein
VQNQVEVDAEFPKHEEWVVKERKLFDGSKVCKGIVWNKLIEHIQNVTQTENHLAEGLGKLFASIAAIY